METWSFEGNPPSTLHCAGVKKEDWKIGEMVTVTAVKPGRTKHFGFGKMIKYSDGTSSSSARRGIRTILARCTLSCSGKRALALYEFQTGDYR